VHFCGKCKFVKELSHPNYSGTGKRKVILWLVMSSDLCYTQLLYYRTRYFIFKYYFLKKEGKAYGITIQLLSICLCAPPSNNFWTNQSIFIKFRREVVPLKVTSMTYFLILWLQPFLNAGHSNFWGGCKIAPVNMGQWNFVCW
jgi:hypothetical protein